MKTNKSNISKIVKKSKTSKKSIKTANVSKSSYLNEFEELKKTISNWDDLYDVRVTVKERLQALTRIEVIGQHLCDKYAWAVPNKRALQILQHFAPLVEIGCGKAYWASLLKDLNVDIVAVDKYIDPKTCWVEIVKGGPEILSKKNMIGRNLFLCYPDEEESVGIECLKRFKGEYIIHVGEMISTGGTKSGYPQAPFGRTTSSDFQIKLMEQFHCLLIANIPTYPFSKDTLSVWKRTAFVEGLPQDNNNGDDDDDNDDDLSGVSASENLWTSIPMDEILPVERAAPCLQHLLRYEVEK